MVHQDCNSVVECTQDGQVALLSLISVFVHHSASSGALIPDTQSSLISPIAHTIGPFKLV